MQFRERSNEIIRRDPYVLCSSHGLRRRFGARGLSAAMELLAQVRERRPSPRRWFGGPPRCRTCGKGLASTRVSGAHHLRVGSDAAEGALSITGPTVSCRCGAEHYALPDVALELLLDWLYVCEGWPQGVVPVPPGPPRHVHVEGG